MNYKNYAVLSVLLLTLGCDGLTPEERQKCMHLPPSGYVADVIQGRVEFNQYCASCHGQNGNGTQQGAPLVHETYRYGHYANLSFHMAVRDGVRAHHWHFGDMKPLPDVTPEATVNIIAFIRNEQRKAGIE